MTTYRENPYIVTRTGDGDVTLKLPRTMGNWQIKVLPIDAEGDPSAATGTATVEIKSDAVSDFEPLYDGETALSIDLSQPDSKTFDARVHEIKVTVADLATATGVRVIVHAGE